MGNISNQVGLRIKDYRKNAGLTQEKLALEAGINVSFLGDVERGLKKPSISSLEKILSVLGISFQEFFDFEIKLKTFKEYSALERINTELQKRSEEEVQLIYEIIKKILKFEDRK